MNILADFYINFDELKEGDKLYEIAEQSEITIRHIFKNDKFAIVCGKFTHTTYMKDGRRYDSDTHPRLLKANPFAYVGVLHSQQKEQLDNEDTKNIYL